MEWPHPGGIILLAPFLRPVKGAIHVLKLRVGLFPGGEHCHEFCRPPLVAPLIPLPE